jgi:hypothetical protein
MRLSVGLKGMVQKFLSQNNWNKTMKTLILTVLMALSFCSLPPAFAEPDEPEALPDMLTEEYITGKVMKKTSLSPQKGPLSLMSHEAGTAGLTEEKAERLEIQLTSGPDQGKAIQIENILSGHPAYDIHVEPGQAVLLYADPVANEMSNEDPPRDISERYHLADHVRSPVMGVYLIVLLAALSWLLGRTTWMWLLGMTVFSFLTLTLTLPGLLSGTPAWILACLALSTLTLPWLGQIYQQYKTPDTAIYQNKEGMVSLLIAVGVLSLVVFLTSGLFMLFCHLTASQGFLNETLANLWQANQPRDFRQMLLCLTLPAFVGLVMYQVSQTYARLQEDSNVQDSQLWETLKVDWAQFITVFVLGALALCVMPALDLTHTDPNKLLNLESNALLVGLVTSCLLGLVASGPLTYWLVRRYL